MLNTKLREQINVNTGSYNILCIIIEDGVHLLVKIAESGIVTAVSEVKLESINCSLNYTSVC